MLVNTKIVINNVVVSDWSPASSHRFGVSMPSSGVDFTRTATNMADYKNMGSPHALNCLLMKGCGSGRAGGDMGVLI